MLNEYEGLDSEAPKTRTPIQNNLIYEDHRYSLSYTLVEHSVLTYAYSFNEKPRHGKFFPEKARELGIPESRLWKELQEGKIIEFKGKQINPVKEGIVGPKRIGRKITYSGDTAPSENLIELGRNSDILIHEATFSKELKQNAIDKKHSTSIDAANIAKKMNAGQLILTHISSRYQEDAIRLLEESKKIFNNTILAKDLMRIKIN